MTERAPFNPEIHASLLALGFAHLAHAATFEDYGDGESGPSLSGHPAFDEYESEAERIIVDSLGAVVMREDRDLALEAWIEAHA